MKQLILNIIGAILLAATVGLGLSAVQQTVSKEAGSQQYHYEVKTLPCENHNV